MKLPELIYGRLGQVTRKTQALASNLNSEGRIHEFGAGPVLDTATAEGLVLVDKEPEPSKFAQFHCYLMPKAIIKVSAQSEIRNNVHRWLMASLEDETRFLCTLGGEAWLGLEEREPAVVHRYVDAAILHWPLIKKERKRFGPRHSEWDVLDLWRTLAAALEMLGVTAEQRMEKPGREPRELLALVPGTHE
ncbi:MAG: hypothetical protein ABUL62_14400 [Myxococcales bacterium]